MVRLIWSPRSLRDLDAICEYIARDSEYYARVFARRLLRFIESIPRHPLLGEVVPEYGNQTLRERRFRDYRIVYRVFADRVELVTIFHGARTLPPSPPQS